MKSKCIIYLVGLPCSGKSTFAKFAFPDTPIISNDAIIEEIAVEKGKTYNEIFNSVNFKDVKKKCRERFEQLVENNTPLIIIDNTHMTIKSRRTYRHPDYDIYCVVFYEDDNVIQQRNMERSKNGKTIPAEVFENMKKSFQVPTLDEGFSRIAIYRHGAFERMFTL